jgi:hypothetical protein
MTHGNEFIHYRETSDEKRIRHRSMGMFNDSARCGNGAPVYRLKSTRKWDEVTCPACLEYNWRAKRYD